MNHHARHDSGGLIAIGSSILCLIGLLYVLYITGEIL